MRRLRRRAAFSLVELMVALTLGALVVAAIFTLAGASAHHFEEQQRVGQLQRAVRMAMDRFARDVARAGFLSVPHDNAPGVQVCPNPPVGRTFPAIAFTNDDPAGNAALDAISRGENAVSADQVTLIGNFATADAYLVRGLNAANNVVFLQIDWLAFRRSFAVETAGGPTLDANRFQDVFRAGRGLHIVTNTQQHYFVNITGSALNVAAGIASVNISPALPNADTGCHSGFCEGCLAAPLSEVRYAIEPSVAGSNLAPLSAAVTGANTQWVRQELNMASGAPLAGTRRVLLDYAVDFNLDFVVDTQLNAGQPPQIVVQAGPAAAATVTATPWRVRGLNARITGRTPEQDARFPWPDEWAGGRPGTAPLNRYRVNTTQQGAARVRTMRAEILMPNLVTP